MATTYTDAQQLWPVSGQGLNCSGILGTPIVANTTNSRVCGVQTNRTLAERCCGPAEIQEYQCWLYCETTDSMNDWAQCVSGGNSTANATAAAFGSFCQGGLVSNNTERLTSAAFRSSAPKYSWAILALVVAFLFVGPAQAAIIPSLDTSLAKRQSDGGCGLRMESNYTSLQHGSKKATPSFDCTNAAGNFCAFDVQVETSITENNRTLNGSSAAEPEFDAFFDLVSSLVHGRKFPAMSSVELSHGLMVPRGSTRFLGWTPISVRFLSISHALCLC